MKFDRKGEILWSEWDGEGYNVSFPSSLVYVTRTHVSIEEPVVLRALASILQRDGIVDSLGDGYRLIETKSVASEGFVGTVDGHYAETVCSDEGETYYGDIVDEVAPVTFVEVALNES